MATKPGTLEKLTGLAGRFGAFVAERYPFSLTDALEAFHTATRGRDPRGEKAIEALRPGLRLAITDRLRARPLPPTPGLRPPPPAFLQNVVFVWLSIC